MIASKNWTLHLNATATGGGAEKKLEGGVNGQSK